MTTRHVFLIALLGGSDEPKAAAPSQTAPPRQQPLPLPPAAQVVAVDPTKLTRDRAWAPYGRQLPSISRPAGIDVIVYKSARTRQIEDAASAAPTPSPRSRPRPPA